MDPELDATGVRQAELAGERLSKWGIGAIYCSELQRAARTAQIINGYAQARLILLPDLRELSYGTWEGKRREEVERENAVFIQQWLQDRFHISAPGGESFHDLGIRLERVVALLTHATADKIAVVTHQGVLKALLCLFLEISPAKQAHFWFHNGSISAVEYDRPAHHFKILFLNDCAHLEQV